MKISNYLAITSFVFFTLSSQAALTESRLPKEIELQRLILAAEDSISKKEFSTSLKYLQRAKDLDIELPAEYYFFQGQSLELSNQFDGAYYAYEEYVLESGVDGTYFKESLMALNRLEGQVLNTNKDSSRLTTNAKNMVWASDFKPKNNEEYLEQIMSLYLSKSKIEALISHINSLLVSEPFTGVSPFNNLQASSLEYSIALAEDSKIIINKTQKINGASQLLSFKTSVFGLSSDFDLQCEESLFKCTIKHSDTSTTWFEIAHNPEISDQIITAATLLIQALQMNSSETNIQLNEQQLK